MAITALRSRISLNGLAFALHRVRQRIAALIAYTTDWALFIGMVLILGLGSSWYMIERGSPLTTVTVGPWVSWTSAGRPDADPYTRAHEARLGILPLSSAIAQTFMATADFEGRPLHSSCEYLVEGHELPGYWWSLAVYDAGGRLIPNTLNRYSFTSDTIAIKPNGSYVTILSRDATPGNWIPIGGAGRLTLVLTVIDLDTRTVTQDGEIEGMVPTITRQGC